MLITTKKGKLNSFPLPVNVDFAEKHFFMNELFIRKTTP